MSASFSFYPTGSSPNGSHVRLSSGIAADEEELHPCNRDRVFDELLDAEVAVNLEKLREAARMGIPPAYRGVVYRYLLGVAFTDKSSEMTVEETQDKDFTLLQTAHNRIFGDGDDDDDDRAAAGAGVGTSSGAGCVRGAVGSGVGGVGSGARNGAGTGPTSQALRMLLAFSPIATAAAVGVNDLAGPLHISGLTEDPASNGSGVGTPSSWADAGLALCPLTMPYVYRGASTVLADGGTASLAAWTESLIALQRCAPYNRDARLRSKMEAAVAALQVVYSVVSIDRVQLLALFTRQLDLVSGTARDTFFTVHALYQLLSQEGNILCDAAALQRHCGNFSLLFRATLLPLYEHFIAEGLTTWEWVPGLLTGFFAGRMHPDDVFALWDYYLADTSESQRMGMHAYACLATLSAMTETLIESEKTELLFCLEHLPRIDTAAIMRKAVLIRESVYSKELLAG